MTLIAGHIWDMKYRFKTPADTLTVESLALDWRPLQTSMKGAIGLDEAHYPSGALLGTVDAEEQVGLFLGWNFSAPQLGQLILSRNF